VKILLGITVILVCCFPQLCCRERVVSSGQDSNLQRQATEAANNSDSSNERRQKQLSGEEHFGKANSLKDGLSFEEALREYYLAIENGYDTPELRYEIGSLLAYQLDRHQEAIEQYRIAIQRDHGYWRGHWALAQSLLELKHYREALDELDLVKRLDPNSNDEGFYTYHIAKALDGLERYDEALKEYEGFLNRVENTRPEAPDVIDAKERVKAIREKLSRN
jgi:tetratricopeptide (TPR) repeat protein